MNPHLRKFLVSLLCCTIPFPKLRRSIRQYLLVPHNVRPLNEAEFAEYIKGKTVAVVGNGPQQIGKCTGSEIDSADIVVRFNTFDLTKHTEDYGTRTDVWVNGWAGNYNDSKYFDIAQNCKYVIWRGSPIGRKKEIALINFFKKCSQLNIAIKLFPNKKLEKCRFQQEFANKWSPTLGFVMLWYLKTCMQPKSLKVYGFSFLDKSLTQNDLEKIPHFYHANETDARVHNMNIEVEFLRKLFKTKKQKD